jgi:HTH-type transcriptional repressor of NAD biosynthesis genes
METHLEQLRSNCIKVVLFGPESTGKTTLAQALAKHYNTSWVPEYARTYLEEKWHKSAEICAPEDIFPITVGQIKLENEAVKKAHKFLFCDTTPLSTQVYSEAYFDGWCDQRVIQTSKKNRYDLYFLTDIDVPWEEDLLRDRPNQREEMFEKFKTALMQRNLSFTLLNGSHEERMKSAIDKLDKLYETHIYAKR